MSSKQSELTARRETQTSSRTSGRRASTAVKKPVLTAYGKEIKGERVSVLWEGGRWYQGTVKDFNGFDEHLIVYEDGDSRWHNVAEEEAENGVKWLGAKVRPP